MKAWELVGLAYDAAVHCVPCAIEAGMDSDTATDSEGNTPSPIFADSEGWENETCADCGGKLG